MGELHLDIYVERIRREYKVPLLSSTIFFPLVHAGQMFASAIVSFFFLYLLRWMLQLVSPVLTSEKLWLNVLILTIYIRSKVEAKVNMDG